jgi:hypothetical protein
MRPYLLELPQTKVSEKDLQVFYRSVLPCKYIFSPLPWKQYKKENYMVTYCTFMYTYQHTSLR